MSATTKADLDAYNMGGVQKGKGMWQCDGVGGAKPVKLEVEDCEEEGKET